MDKLDLDNLHNYTLEELRQFVNEFKNDYSNYNVKFRFMIVVPMGYGTEPLDDGISYGCMAYIFVNANGEVAGVNNSGSELLNIDGDKIGHYYMDCLLNSGCVCIQCYPRTGDLVSENGMKVCNLGLSITNVYGLK